MERAALVTGAASGIGRAIAARLERDGAQVLARSTSSPIPAALGEPFAADLTTRAGNRDAVAAALERVRPARRRDPERRLPARGAGRGVPRGPLGRHDRAPAHEPVPARPRRLAGAARSRATGASWPSPRCTALVASPFKSALRVGQARAARARARRWRSRAPARASPPARSAPATCARRWWRTRWRPRPRRTACPRSACSRRSSSPRTRVKRLIEPDEVADTVAFLLGDAGRRRSRGSSGCRWTRAWTRAASHDSAGTTHGRRARRYPAEVDVQWRLSQPPRSGRPPARR